MNTGDSFFPEYVLISLGNRDVVHQLVANPEFGVAVYSPQEPLGMARVFEYDYNRSNVRSAFKKNHFKEGSQRSESVTSTFLAGLGIETKKAETETSSTLFDESTGGEGAAVISKEASSILFGGLPESTETSQASPVDSAREDLHAKVTELGDKFTDRQRTIWTKK